MTNSNPTTIPDKNTGDSVTAAEFMQIIEAIQKKLRDINALGISGDTNVFIVDSGDGKILFGGTSDFQDNIIDNIKTAGFKSVDALGSKSASFDVPFDTSNSVSATLTVNTMTITLKTPTSKDSTRKLYLTNGGLATITWAAELGTIQWASGTPPTLTSSGKDILVFVWDGDEEFWVGDILPDVN